MLRTEIGTQRPNIARHFPPADQVALRILLRVNSGHLQQQKLAPKQPDLVDSLPPIPPVNAEGMSGSELDMEIEIRLNSLRDGTVPKFYRDLQILW